MNTVAAQHWTRIGVAVALGLTVLLGNSRIPVIAADGAPVLAGGPGEAPVQASSTSAVAMDSPSGADPKRPRDDIGGFVPAIYAWDPDVRFVYFRHVSKWM